MADHYYSVPLEDSSSAVFAKYNGLSQLQNLSQQQQNHQPQLASMGQSTCALVDYDTISTSNPGYFTNAISNMSNIDINNNNNNANNQIQRNLRYYNYQNKHNSQQYNYNHQHLPPLKNSNMKYMQNICNSSLLNTHTNYGGIMSTTVDAPPMHHQHLPLGVRNGCQYANMNGSASCYNRNRYMPYNHNRACAAAAAVAGSTANVACNDFSMPKSGITYFNSYPQFPSLYYANAGNAMPTTVTAIAQTPITAMKHGMPTSRYERTSAMPISMLQVREYSNGNPTSTATVMQNTANFGGMGNSVPVTCPALMNDTAVAANTTLRNFKAPNSTSGPATSIGTSSVAFVPTTSSAAEYAAVSDPNETVTLQITNLDYSMDEPSLRSFLLNQLKPITPVVALVFEGSSYAKVTVPDLYFAKQVVSNLHRKKIGHKRMLVSYTRDSSLTEINTLRCQVAGLLKDVPYFTLPMYKFRELFQSRFKTSISVLDLYKMQDICSINSDNNEDKFITLQPDLINSLECSPLIEGLQHSVPYCPIHFKREQHKGWADQEIEPLPNVFMTKSEIQQIIYPLLKKHPHDIPVASLVHCIKGELNLQITANDNGVNLEHLVCCVQGIKIQVNNFGIKILGWLELNKEKELIERNAKNAIADPLYQISREVIELLKMSPKSTMKFSRFIPAYHNHFGKQCRVADYGYTKLIELFEALSSVVQILGDGENRQITLTHRIQIRRFTSDLLRVLRAHGNNSVLLSQLPKIFAQTQNRNFDITDYGVCDIVDILDGLVNSNIVVVTTVQKGKDILISIPKRKQTNSELEKTCIFAGEMVELFRNAVQYTILFQKFVRSYHYHFAYQCRLSDYGFLKLADLMDSIHGVVEMEQTNDEDKKIYLSPQVARRVFAEQCEELIRTMTGSAKTCMELSEVLKLHKKKYGYEMRPQTLGVSTIIEAVELLPYVECFEKDNCPWIICHNDDNLFRTQTYRAAKYLVNLQTEIHSNKTKAGNCSTIEKDASTPKSITLSEFIESFNESQKENLNDTTVKAMKHAIEIHTENDVQYVQLTNFMKFLIQIVRTLEHRTELTVHELKVALDCNLTTTFQFAYPSLYALLNAYPDLFTIHMGASQERCEVSLVSNCALCPTGGASQQNFNTMKLPYNKPKVARSLVLPLTEHNGNKHRAAYVQGPPAKTRALSMDNSYHGNNYNYAGSLVKQQNNCAGVYKSATEKPKQHQQASANQQKILNSTIGTLHNNTACHVNSFNNCSMYSMASHNTTLLNSSTSNLSSCSNKENSFNGSFNMFNSSFNASSANSSNVDLNNSYSGIASQLNMQAGQLNIPHQPVVAYPNLNLKFWDCRNVMSLASSANPGINLYQPQQYSQQQPKPMSQPKGAQELNTSKNPTSITLPNSVEFSIPHSNLPQKAVNTNTNTNNTEQTGLYEIVNSMQMCPVYQPPKPDTPPSDVMPFWIDPIWSNNSEQEEPKNNLVNIRLPEIKSMNVLPMLLSPYTLSKTENMKQAFNFDSHDRKIA